MGEVYRARDTRLDRIVAVKVSKEVFSERFEREARVIAALNHPHICALYDVGPDYLVMEYIEGKPLKGPMPMEEALPLAVQIAAALEEAHRKGIVHRDLKPGNILLAKTGVKLLDFGLARVEAPISGTDVTVTATEVGTVLGTAAYMSPEQAEGEIVDARSDIFSFGLVLYELLSGRQAFPGKNLLSTVAAILHREPPPLDAPAALAHIVARCLRKSPAERFQSAAELKAALEDAAAGKSGGAEPSIAVLPFANLSADKENEYFSDGLAEEITNALTKVPGLKVTARASAFFFRGKDVKPADIARELNVEHLLEGSVRKAGNRVRVTAQLIKAADGFQLWSERYDRELTDVFAIQDEIAAAIVTQLKVNLTTSAGARAPMPPANVAAYEAVLEGRHLWHQLTPGSFARALERFERAVSIDSRYAPAHVGVAGYYVGLAALAMADPRQVLSKARAAAQRASELDPSDADAQSYLATVSALLDHDWPACERYCRRAIELNPASALARFPYSFWYLRVLGRLDEALAEADRVLEIDPLTPVSRYCRAIILLCMRRYDAALHAYQQTVELDPSYSLGLMGLAQTQARMGRYGDAIANVEKVIQFHGRWPAPLWTLADCHALAGHKDQARTLLAEILELAQRSSVASAGLAAVYGDLGELDAAFEWAGKAIEQRDPLILSIKTGPLFDPLRADPRYPALLRNMNLS